jgi:DNA repair ATPase RecN
MITLLCLCCFVLCAATAVWAQTDPQAAQQKQLLNEVKKLRLELVQQSIEFRQWKLKQLERELQQVQAEQQRLAEEQALLTAGLNELSAGGDAQGELAALKTELSGHDLPKLLARQEPLARRASDLLAQVKEEEARLRQLAQQTARLKAETQ